MSEYIDGTLSLAYSRQVDDFSSDVVTNDYYRTNCTSAVLWNKVAHGIVGLERSLCLDKISESLQYPTSIAINSSGDVYVVDTWEDTISVYGASGTVIRSWGGPGTATGNFDYAAGVAIDSNDNVHVCDVMNRRVQRFSNVGAYLGSYNGASRPGGSFMGRFWAITSGECSGTQCVWLVDSGATTGTHLSAFAENGDYIAGSRRELLVSGNSINADVRALTYHASGYVLAADWYNNRILVHNINTAATTTFSLSGALGLCVDPASNVWATTTKDRVIRSYSFSAGTLTFSASFAAAVTCKPYGLAAATAYGTTALYLCDTESKRIVVYSAVGNQLGTFHSKEASGVWSPGTIKGSKLSGNVLGSYKNTITGNIVGHKAAELYGNKLWQGVLLTQTAQVTSAGSVPYIDFNLAVVCPTGVTAWPLDWRLGVRSRGEAPKLVVRVLRPCSGTGGEPAHVVVGAGGSTLNFRCRMSCEDGTNVPSTTLAPYTVTGIVQARRI